MTGVRVGCVKQCNSSEWVSEWLQCSVCYYWLVAVTSWSVTGDGRRRGRRHSERATVQTDDSSTVRHRAASAVQLPPDKYVTRVVILCCLLCPSCTVSVWDDWHLCACCLLLTSSSCYLIILFSTFCSSTLHLLHYSAHYLLSTIIFMLLTHDFSFYLPDVN